MNNIRGSQHLNYLLRTIWWGFGSFAYIQLWLAVSRRLEHLFMLSVTVLAATKVADETSNQTKRLVACAPTIVILLYVQMFCLAVFCSMLLRCFFLDFGKKIILTNSQDKTKSDHLAVWCLYLIAFVFQPQLFSFCRTFSAVIVLIVNLVVTLFKITNFLSSVEYWRRFSLGQQSETNHPWNNLFLAWGTMCPWRVIALVVWGGAQHH